jgi:NAD(P)-dependent dehydrogenase (short-subunit alcohol dehydrogenase family)
MNNKKFWKYFKEYEWSNIFAMIRNNRLDPKICSDGFANKLVVITGATSGIGYLTARKYASMGADLLCVNRSQVKSENLKAEIEGEFDVKCDYRIADLSNLDDVHRVGQELSRSTLKIDVLIHNAGVYLTKRESTSDGLEKVFMVHHLSSFIINYYLVEKLKSQDKARIIVVSSEGHRFAAWGLKLNDLMWEKRRYSGLKSYGSAKTAQLLSILIFARLFNDSGVTINAMHPGAVKTETGQENGAGYKWFKKHVLDRTLRSPDISAEALYYMGVSEEMAGVSGKFFNLTEMEEPAPPALDMEVAGELWQISLDLGRLNTQTEKD